jgi:hypothetical protein
MDVRFLAGLMAVVVVQGCTTEPVKTEADFGNSVRQMIAAQRVDGGPSARPGSLDGHQAEKVLQAWRGEVARPQDLKTDVNMPLGK